MKTKKNQFKILLCLILFGFVMPKLSAQILYDGLDTLNSTLFSKSDGWTNGNPFNCYWRASCITFSSGILTLTLDYEGGQPPYKSGEYRTVKNYRYGLYEVRMKAAKASGTVSSFFVYTGPSEGNPWDEIDIEILGKDPTRMQTNYYTNGVGGKETMISLGFDASAGLHTYGFEWLANSIKWYVDGKLVHTETGSKGPLPVTASKIMVNLWPGIGVDGWLGPFNGNVPVKAEYDWIRFTPAGTVLSGDVDGNGKVDITDALKVAQYSAGLNPANFVTSAADTDKNGKIDILDALRIARYVAGLIPDL
jgi:beta-glucanase (GH16 family)